jgi:hypothetical protein
VVEVFCEEEVRHSAARVLVGQGRAADGRAFMRARSSGPRVSDLRILRCRQNTGSRSRSVAQGSRRWSQPRWMPSKQSWPKEKPRSNTCAAARRARLPRPGRPSTPACRDWGTATRGRHESEARARQLEQSLEQAQASQERQRREFAAQQTAWNETARQTEQVNAEREKRLLLKTGNSSCYRDNSSYHDSKFVRLNWQA